MKRVLILGGTGFIGSYLVPELLKEGYKISVLTRSPEKAKTLPSGVEVIKGNPLCLEDLKDVCRSIDVAINLAGQNIFGRWTKRYKKLILESRIKATENLVRCLKTGAILVNASAIGYYGSGFLSEVCYEWEKRAISGRKKGLKVIILRIGVVLGN